MKRLKLVADDRIPFLRGALEPYAEVVYLPGACISRRDLAGADALFTRTRTRCDAALLQGTNVGLIATATIGYDHIDAAYCEAGGIRWVNAPGCNSSSVQQYVVALLLTWVRRRGLRLSDLVLGVVGVGNVGGKVAAAGAALGMRVLLNDPPRAGSEGPEGFVPLDELLRQSDVVTCHTPLVQAGPYPTRRLASGAFFEQMKTGAFFVNSSRGAVTDSEALKRAAQTKLGGFALDVWEGEPAVDPVLLDRAFVATPHIAGYSADGKANGTAACVREFGSFFGLDVLADWYPASLPPPPASLGLTIDCRGKTDEQILYEAATHTYPIEEDSRRLKESPGSFEKQRGNYWVRREFGSFTLRLICAGSATAGKLEALGFKIIHSINK
jgi:erythronate-4-phosphate dehydrogenase